MKLIAKLFLAAWAFVPLEICAQELKVTADKPNALYQIHQQVTWTISGAVPGAKPIPYVVLADGQTTHLTGKLVFTNGRATVTTTLRSRPRRKGYELPTFDGPSMRYAGVARTCCHFSPSSRSTTDACSPDR
jgi:hypothetical protein